MYLVLIQETWENDPVLGVCWMDKDKNNIGLLQKKSLVGEKPQPWISNGSPILINLYVLYIYILFFN